MAYDSTPYLAEVVAPIVQELEERLDDDLTEKDRIALATAMGKVSVAGFRQGVLSTQTAIAVEEGKMFAVNVEQPDPSDEWAELYGEE